MLFVDFFSSIFQLLVEFSAIFLFVKFLTIPAVVKPMFGFSLSQCSGLAKASVRGHAGPGSSWKRMKVYGASIPLLLAIF